MSLINGPKDIKSGLSAPSATNVISAASSGASAILQKAAGVRFDPAPAYLFLVEISGVAVGAFTECTGMGATRAIERISEGGVNDHDYVLPGKIDYSNIVLKRGLSLSREIWNWFVTGMYDFKVQRHNITITQGAPGHNLLAAIMDSGYGIMKRWNVDKAIPVSWKLSDLSVNSQDIVAIESLEIAHEGLSLDLLAGTPMTPMGAIMDVLS